MFTNRNQFDIFQDHYIVLFGWESISKNRHWINTDSLEKLLDESVALVAINHCPSQNGLINDLAGIGEISSLHCDLAALPAIDSLDAESCHLGFDFSLVTDAAQAEIEAAFSFVRDDCVLRLAGGDLVVDEAQPMPAAPAHSDAEPPTLQNAMPPAGPPVGPPNTDPSLDAKPARQRQSAADDHRFIRVHADRLDAVLCLVQAAWASVRRDENWGLPVRADRIEGWIVGA